MKSAEQKAASNASSRAWRARHREGQRAYYKKYRKRNRAKISQDSRAYKLRNPKKVLAGNRAWRANNREADRRIRKCARVRRLSADPGIRIKEALRSRLTEVVTRAGLRKAGRTFDLLGCSLVEFRAHIESQFLTGMTWENRGKFGWHIDHKRPCASFDLTDPEQQKICFHHTNLQPLWYGDNLSKGSRW